MIERLLFMTCAAYLVAAFPACAQDGSSYHDSCGGDSARRTLTILATMTAMRVTPTRHHRASQATPNTMLDFRRGKWTR